MGEEHNVGFGQGPKVNRATSTPTSPSICLLRHKALAIITLHWQMSTNIGKRQETSPYVGKYHLRQANVAYQWQMSPKVR